MVTADGSGNYLPFANVNFQTNGDGIYFKPATGSQAYLIENASNQTEERMGINGKILLNNAGRRVGSMDGSGNLSVNGSVTPSAESGYSGYGACYATGGKMGHCTTGLSSSGTCTCITP